MRLDLKDPRTKQTAQLVALGLLGVLLLVFNGFFGGAKAGRQVEVVPQAAAVVQPRTAGDNPVVEARAIAAELERVLASVAGAGKVTVAVTLQAGSQRLLATNVTASDKQVTERDTQGGTRVTTESSRSSQVVISGSEGPLTIGTLGPVIAGVLVTADGASDSRVRLELTRAVQAALNLPAHRVRVVPRKGG